MMAIFFTHRGRGTAFLEQTRQALDAAIEWGVAGLEVDLRVTRDRVLVLSHSKSFRRLNGDQRVVNTLDWNVISGFCTTEGERVLAFDEFARDYSGYRWILDIKKRTGPEVIECLREWADRHDRLAFLQENAHFLVWRRAHRRILDRAFPNAHHALNSVECLFAGLGGIDNLWRRTVTRQGHLVSIPPQLLRFPRLETRLIESLRQGGHILMLYLPQTAAEVQRALSLGFDYVLTDVPGHARLGCRAVG